MQTKRIKCPNCSVILDVRNSKNETLKLITCPSCRAKLQVKFEPTQEPLIGVTIMSPSPPNSNDGATQLAGSTSDSGATQLAGSGNGATQLGSAKHNPSDTPRLLFGETVYELKEGRNIVGRKGTTSQATVQIETADRYMSRQHSLVTVTKLPDQSLKVVLSNYQNKNATLVDGQPIETGDEIRLTNGDTITMGKTTVTFKL